MFPAQPQIHQKNNFLRWLVLFLGMVLLLDLVSYLIVEGLWFQEVEYAQIFKLRLLTQGGLGLLVFGSSIGFALGNLMLARRWALSEQVPAGLSGSSRNLGLRGLLPLVFCLSLLLAVMLLYYGQIAVSHWHSDLSVGSSSIQLPVKFRPESLWQIGQQCITQLRQLGFLMGLAIALLIYPQPLLGAIAVLMSLGFSLVLSEHWTKVLLSFHPTLFNRDDPLFGRDIAFFVFTLPMWKLLEFWLIGLMALAFLSVSLVYLLSENSLSQGKFLGFSASQQRHLFGLGGCLMLAIALTHWLDRYELLYSHGSIAYGASYTDVTVQLPAYTLLSIVALSGALYLLGRAILTTRKLHSNSNFPLLYLLGLYLSLEAIAVFAMPAAVQALGVEPNELQLEQPYIERSIAMTREAFKLQEIEVRTFDPEYSLTFADLQRNHLTIDNIRLWDTRPLLETNRQLQRIRSYYEFPDADIDRYTLTSDAGESTQQQVLIAARELDYSSVPAEAQTWINQHLIYTHGYGFTLSPVNTAAPGGLPDYFIQGIEQIPSSDRIRNSIPIGKPRIYYGEITNTHVMTGTQVRELDYSSGSENVYNTYQGKGGIGIGHFWQRLIFAKHLHDWRMLLTEDFTPNTRLLFRRNIQQRVRAIAPFLRYDSDPYLVVADAGGQKELGSQLPNYLYWVIDAYTTSDRYPYSDPGNNDFNYIRNSVKVVIDAYHGSVKFYVADAQDPLIQSWSQVFPEMFQPLETMPAALRSHIRYPQDFYQVQSDQLMVYHMTDPQVFYNREDQWRAPNEIYGSQPQLVEPYYLIMKLPIGTNEEFILFRPFTPNQRTNLIAWLAGRSDGDRYGSMLLYRFPKQELVYGPEQLEARINQDPVISQQISLWNHRGSKAVQGNLLVIPIERSLLYVEPLYLEAEQNSLPTLVRVIAAYQNRIVMAETLEEALEAIFQPQPTTTPAIVRPLDETAPLP